MYFITCKKIWWDFAAGIAYKPYPQGTMFILLGLLLNNGSHAKVCTQCMINNKGTRVREIKKKEKQNPPPPHPPKKIHINKRTKREKKYMLNIPHH